MKRTHTIGRGLAGMALVISLLSLIASSVRTSTATSSTPAASISSVAVSEGEKESTVAALTEMPLQFIENHGQVDRRVAFYVQGRDKTLFFTPQGVTFALISKETDAGKPTNQTGLLSTNDLSKLAEQDRRQRWALKLDFVNPNPQVTLKAEDPTHTLTNYLQGNRAHWRTRLASYQTLTYENLWPGIDLVYSGNGDRLKYQFIVRPGADPDQIKLAYRGASAISLNAQGQLAVTTPLGDFHDDNPYSYQEINGQRLEVKTSYAVAAKARQGRYSYSFRVDGYDHSKPLIIDPAILVYAGYIGGAGDERGFGIAVDRSGNAYVTGATSSSQLTFPVAGGPDLTFDGVQDVFIVKINSTGTGIVYATYLGGTGDDVGFDIALDNEGNAYVTGATSSTEASFPVVNGPDLSYNGGAYDAFVAKLNAAGTGLVYCGYVGGSGQEGGGGIAVDGSGNAYITGGTTSSEATFPVSVGPDLTYNGGLFFGDAFIAKVKAAGMALEFCGYIGGSGEDAGLAIAVDPSGSAYIAGGTTSDERTFPVAVGPDLTFNGGSRDAFVAKVNAAGAALVYAGYIGGASGDTALGIALDSTRNAYVTGDTSSNETSFPVAVGPDLTYNGGGDAFIAKVNSAGTAFVYCGYIGGINRDTGTDVRVGAAGNAYVTGATVSTETTFPVKVGPDLIFNGGGDGGDAFVAKLNASGTALDYCGYVGGSASDIGYALALDSDGNVYITGETTSTQTTFPAVAGPDLTYNEGAHDAFVARIGAGPVNRVTPAISWNNAADLSYGTPLGAGQLNAIASFNGIEVPGTFVYTPAAGTVLNAGNGQTLSVTFTPTDTTRYNQAVSTVAINVKRAPATISLSNLTQAYDGSPKPATATTSPAGLSGVSITYVGSTTPPTNPGSYALVASLNNSNYVAPNVIGTLVITAAKHSTNLAYTGSTLIGAGELAVLSAVLTDTSASTSSPIAGRTVTLTLGSGTSAQSCNAVTGNNGSARCTISAVNQLLGAGTVAVRFGGDSHYLASSSSARVWIFTREACFVVDFREITYFRNTQVLTSSDANIRTRNGISGGFDPSRWPYAPQGGSNKTKSRATLFRVYGFSANQLGVAIPNADNANLTYIVKADTEISGAYYIDLGGPARVVICPSQLQTHLIGEGEQVKPWSLSGSSPLTDAQRNVPGIMLTHNVTKVAIPDRVRDELRRLGLPLVDAHGHEAQSGLVDYIGFQLWGHGNADYREFVDVSLRYIFDDAADRLKHYKFGFHTAKNGDLETFAGCSYLDHAPGNDGVRFNDVWAGRNQNNPQWGPACGSLEPLQNQKVRENYAVPLDGIQILPTVNTNDDTMRVLFGRIRPAN